MNLKIIFSIFNTQYSILNICTFNISLPFILYTYNFYNSRQLFGALTTIFQAINISFALCLVKVRNVLTPPSNIRMPKFTILSPQISPVTFKMLFLRPLYHLLLSRMLFNSSLNTPNSQPTIVFLFFRTFFNRSSTFFAYGG